MPQTYKKPEFQALIKKYKKNPNILKTIKMPE